MHAEQGSLRGGRRDEASFEHPLDGSTHCNSGQSKLDSTLKAQSDFILIAPR